jgi:hypothetical protein
MFRTGMKCIENHPKRNALVTGSGASSSTRALQVTIETLKRELVMRDAIHSYSRQSMSSGLGKSSGTMLKQSSGMNDGQQGGVYSGTLSNNQQNITVNMACEYGIQGGMELNLPSAVAERELEINSVAQAHAMAASLRCALWQACDGDADKVSLALDKMKASFSG